MTMFFNNLSIEGGGGGGLRLLVCSKISFSILILKLESNLNKFVSRYEFYNGNGSSIFYFSYLNEIFISIVLSTDKHS